MKIIFYTIAGFFGLVLVLGFLATATSLISAPGRVMRETLQTQNIIDNYELFFDLNAGFERRVADINSYRELMVGASGDEANRLRIEFKGLQQTCRDIATRYNAASAKLNRSVFKDSDLPYTLNLASCE